MSAYLENFSDNESIIQAYDAPKDALDGAEVLIAWYGYGSYCGSSYVLFRKGDKLFEVNGSHCSCYGLEGLWDPEETTYTALATSLENENIFYNEYDGSQEASKTYREVVTRLISAG